MEHHEARSREQISILTLFSILHATCNSLASVSFSRFAAQTRCAARSPDRTTIGCCASCRKNKLSSYQFAFRKGRNLYYYCRSPLRVKKNAGARVAHPSRLRSSLIILGPFSCEWGGPPASSAAPSRGWGRSEGGRHA